MVTLFTLPVYLLLCCIFGLDFSACEMLPPVIVIIIAVPVAIVP